MNRSGPVNNTQDIRKNKTTSYEINRSKVEVVKSPGEIKYISAAVFLAMRYNEAAESPTPEPRTTDELERIRKMVTNALGIAVTVENSKQQVTVEEIPFEKTAVIGESGFGNMEKTVFQWFDIGRNFVAVGIAVIMFFIFFRMIKSHKADFVGIEIVDNEELIPSPQPKDLKAQLKPEYYNDLIMDKPDNVSTALKNWVTSGTNK